jgi:hypothetical protein
MTDLSITEEILKELADLPESRQADVLVFVRFLKIGLADVSSIPPKFDQAVNQARKIAESQDISPEDINNEIRGYRTKT